jgi:hypothetical protein
MSIAKVSASQHQNYNLLAILAFLFPVIGLIATVIFLTKERPLDKKVGQSLLFISLLGFVVWGSVLYFFNAKQAEETQKQIDTAQQELTNELEAIQQSSQASYENTERETDIKALQGQVEAYYAVNGYYPTLNDLNNKSFRESNMVGLSDEALIDPAGSRPTLTSKPTKSAYSYEVSPQGCDNTDPAKACTSYVLTATYEGTVSGAGTYAKEALN